MQNSASTLERSSSRQSNGIQNSIEKGGTEEGAYQIGLSIWNEQSFQLFWIRQLSCLSTRLSINILAVAYKGCSLYVAKLCTKAKGGPLQQTTSPKQKLFDSSTCSQKKWTLFAYCKSRNKSDTLRLFWDCPRIFSRIGTTRRRLSILRLAQEDASSWL